MEFSFQTFGFYFNFNLLIFLLTVQHNKKQNEIQN